MELFTTKDNTAINYETKGSGHPLVMIHSAFENYSIFDQIADKLAHSYQIVLIDLRGHGFSDKPMEINFETYASDIKELLDHLYIRHAFFIGQELGASIAVDLAVKHSDYTDALVLVNPTTVQKELPSERLFKKYADKIRTWEEDEQEKFLDKHTYGSMKKIKKFFKNVSDTTGLMTEHEKKAVTKSFTRDNIAIELNEVKASTLIIAGKYDERSTSEDIETFLHDIPDAQLETFKHSGLYPMVEEKREFLEVATAFFNVQSVLDDEQKRLHTSHKA